MEIKISGKKIFWGLVIIVIVLAVAAWVWIAVEAINSPEGPSPYSAVYLTSGDIYFGKLSWFPQPHMTDVWYLNRSVGTNGQSQVSVVPLKTAFWGPVNGITLNPQQILFWTNLSNSSQLVKDMENPSLLQQQQAQSPSSFPGASSTVPAAALPPASSTVTAPAGH